VREVDVPIAGLPPALHGFTLVQITDLHVGVTIRRGFVQRVVDTVNGLRPDAVVVTGDTIDGRVDELREHVAPLGTLAARHGVYAVTGNHEYYSGAPAWIAEYRRLGMRVLLNEHVVLQHGEAALVLAGITDFSAGHFDAAHRSDPARALHGAPPGAPRVLLAHQPRSADAAERAGADLQVSGHTHGGQFLPWRWFVPLQQPYTAGLHRHGRMWIYISRGTGYWGPPKRLGAPSEITRLRLVAA
jgi:predicted MPP superfamily phosphohydrolase